MSLSSSLSICFLFFLLLFLLPCAAVSQPIFVTTANSINVPEGSTAAVQVKLSTQPASSTTVSVSIESGDIDITIHSGASLTFTPSDWDTYKTVVLRAAEDDDTVNNQATVLFRSVSGATVTPHRITATERDNDELNFHLLPSSLVIPEGATAPLQIKLTAMPTSSVSAEIRLSGGDSDIRLLSDPVLFFTPSNWDQYQTLIFEARTDVDDLHGKSLFVIQSISGPYVSTHAFNIAELDDDPLFFIPNPKIPSIPEGATAPLQVKLSVQPPKDISVSASIIRGDPDIRLYSNTSLIFTPDNWDVYQEIILSATEDDDFVDGAATLLLQSESTPSIPDLKVAVRELDNDSLGFVLLPQAPVVLEGATTELRIVLSAKIPNPVTAVIDTYAAEPEIHLITGSILTFDSSNWNQSHSVIFGASIDANRKDDSALYSLHAQEGYIVPTVVFSVKEIDRDNPHFVLSSDSLTIQEGLTGDIHIRLSTKPAEILTAAVEWQTEHSDFVLQSATSHTFTQSNWNENQTISIFTRHDPDITNEEASLLIYSASHPSTPAVEITVQSQDVTQWIVVTEMFLTVNGRSDADVNTSELGIGHHVDSASAIFEIAPGDRFAVDAVISTFENEPPDTIHIDLSDLYPPGLHNVVDEIVPTTTRITEAGNIHARWESIVFDYRDTRPMRAGINSYASRWFADQSVLRSNIANGNIFRFNGNFTEATPTTRVDLIGATGAHSSFGIPLQKTLDALEGLPYIQVQHGAFSKRIASVTVIVDDIDAQSIPLRQSSAKFTLDASPPQVSYRIPSELILRKLPPTYAFTNPASPRLGFPTAPNLDGIDQVPNRIRAGDVLSIIVDATNTRLDGEGNDEFRSLPNIKHSFFNLLSQPALLNVTADLSCFATSVQNAVANTHDSFSPHSLEIIPQTGKASLIKATFSVMVEENAGTTALASKSACQVTVTVMDDAGNRPFNTLYDQSIVRKIGPPLSVDNAGPTISGNVEVVLVAGSAKYPTGVNPAPGEKIPPGSLISAGSVLRITTTIFDFVDHPLDIWYNRNYGSPTLNATGIIIPDSYVKLETKYVDLVGEDTLIVPFLVQLPSASENESTNSFRFVVHATDTVGSTEAKPSNAVFGLDGKPSITFFRNNTLLSPNDSRRLLYHAGTPPLHLKAAGFDINGISSVQWIVEPTSYADLQIHSNPPVSGFILTDPSSPQNLDLELLISSPAKSAATQPVIATAVVKDNQNNTTIGSPFTVVINRPAFFEESFDLQQITSAGRILPDFTSIEASTAGLQTVFGEDIRETTMPEGSTLTMTIEAVDSDQDPILLNATGTALTSSEIENGMFLTSMGNGSFTFQPGYLSLVGEATAATYTLNITAQDLFSGRTPKHTFKDHTSLVLNVAPKAATPEVEVISVKLNNSPRPATIGDSVEMREETRVQLVLQGVDPGLDDLTFSASNSLSVPFDYSVETSTGTITATVNYRAGSIFPELPDLETRQVPILFTFNFTNTPLSSEPVTTLVTKEVLVTLSSKPPQISTSVSIDDNPPTNLSDKQWTFTEPDSTLTFNFHVQDPDGDSVLLPNVNLNASERISFSTSIVDIQPTSIDYELILNIPSFIAREESTVVVTFTAMDSTGVSNQDIYYVQIRSSETTDADELIISCGHGGGNGVNVRNLSPNASIPINGVLRGFNFAPTSFHEKVGGGLSRAVYVSAGDVNHDGNPDIVTTLGPIERESTFPNLVIVRDGSTKEIIGHPFSAFPKGNNNRAVEYNHGELRTVVGNFVRAGENHIAVAQGVKGNQVVRLFQYTGFPAPFGFILEGQFMGLIDSDWIQNASGGITLAAADLDGDSFDELIVAQTYSRYSQTAFQIMDLKWNQNNAFAEVAHRTTNLFGFLQNHLRGNGGIQPVVADLNGDGLKEIVVASLGDDRNRVLRPNQPINLIGVLKPVISNKTVSHVEYPAGYVLNVFPDSVNPSGVLSITAGEFDGIESNGQELAVGTGSFVRIDGLDVESLRAAPINKYVIIKIDYDGNKVRGWSTVSPPLHPPLTPKTGVSAFVGQYAPSSGSLFLSAANTDQADN